MSRTSIGRTVAWALLALTAGWVLARAVRNEPALASRPDERRQIDDLYAIFKDEVSDSVAGNVYEALGNRFQLDGLAYNHLFNALNACDRLRATEAAADFAGKEASRVRQLEAARKSFQGVVENLPWPRFRIVVREGRIDLEGPRELRLDAGIGQPVLLAVSNERADPESVRVTLDGVPAGVSLEVAPRSTRYLLARIERGEAGQSRTEVLATAGAARLVRAVP